MRTHKNTTYEFAKMAYVPQGYIQQNQAASNVILQTNPAIAQSYPQAHTQYYYNQTSHTQSLQIGSGGNQVTAAQIPGNNVGAYYQQPGQYITPQLQYQPNMQGYQYQAQPQFQQTMVPPQSQQNTQMYHQQQQNYRTTANTYSQSQAQQFSQPNIQYNQYGLPTQVVTTQYGYTQSQNPPSSSSYNQYEQLQPKATQNTPKQHEQYSNKPHEHKIYNNQDPSHPKQERGQYDQHKQQNDRITQPQQSHQPRDRQKEQYQNQYGHRDSPQQNRRDYQNQSHQNKHSRNSNHNQDEHNQNQNRYNDQQNDGKRWNKSKSENSQEMETDQPSTSKKKCSPLNDFGDMGAAVLKYVQTVKTKLSLMDSTQSNIMIEKRNADQNKYRQEHGLVAWDDKGDSVIPDPYEHFEDFPGLKDNEINAFYNAGFQAPTPIQAQTWPIVLQGRDVVSIAKTGSGKTLAFLLPAFQKMNQKYLNSNSIHVLVLAPTRELAVQIEDESIKFGREYGHNTACAYGGAPKHSQLQTINSGISVLVATPGRLNDFLDSRQVNLSSVFYLVMDEADRMLDMGFEPQIRSILRRLPRQKQTMMFSATWPEEVRRLADDFLTNPIHIRLGDQSSLQANENIRQFLILLRSGEDKDHELIQLLRSKISTPGNSILVFVARKNTCNFVANMLNRVGISASGMHGDRTQEYREETLARFKEGRLPVLVATDVASRGLDVKGLAAVVNYDMPGATEDYVHRIGRTGRAGLTGESYTFLTHSNEDIWKVTSIVEVMEKTGQPVPDEVQGLIDQLKDRQQRNIQQRAAEDEQFSKVLIVAEKPSVAKMIADSLANNGRYRTRRGKSRANQIFEFIKWFEPAKQKCKIMVTSVVGHIFGLSFENQRVPDIAMLFDAPVKKVIEETSKKLGIVEHLQELGSESQYLYLWLDCDREGENIGFEVISLVSDSIHYDNVYRARFSSLTKTELNQAYSNPIRPDKYAALCVDARQELDLKIGVAFTRLMTHTYLEQARAKFRLKDQRCISYGPCQTPTLWFCVQRHKEIQSFQREKYYELFVDINMQGKKCSFKSNVDKISDVNEVNRIEIAVNSSRNAAVTEVIVNRKTFNRPVGLNTVTLLKACSKGLGMSPTAAMHAAEHLYTSGYISYPRTETTAYSPSFDLVTVLEEQANHPNWGRVASYLLHNGRINSPVGGHDAGDHPPITPVRAVTRNELAKANEWKIYDYVTRHFLGSLHNDFEYAETMIKVNVGSNDFSFTCHDVIDRGFVFAMPWKERSLNLNEMKFQSPQAFQGQNFIITDFKKQESYTKPPDYLQESELITLMDKHGIGTDASIPQHIKNVQDRHYVDVCGPGEDGQKGAIIPVKKYFGKNNRGGGQQQQPRPTSRHMVPRGFGMAFLSSFEYLDGELCEPTIRSYMEKQITKIATGETDKTDVVSSNLKLFLKKFVDFRQNLPKCDRYFAPKQFTDGGDGRRDSFNNNFNNNNFGNQDRGRGRGGRGGNPRGSNGRGSGGSRGGGRGGYNNYDNDQGNQGGSDRGRGRGGRGGIGRGGFSNERGRGFQGGRGKRGNQGFGNGDGFKRQKTWE